MRKQEVQLDITIITDESKQYAKLLKDTDTLIKQFHQAKKKGEDVSGILKKIAESGKAVEKIDLGKLTPAQLLKRARSLSVIMKQIPQSSKEYKRMAEEVQRVNTQLKVANARTRGLSKYTKNAGGIMKRVFGGMLLPLGLSSYAIASVAKEFFGLAGEIEALDKKAKIVFGRTFPFVTAAAEENAAAMGLTTSEYRAQAAAIGDLLIPMGFQRQEAAEISTGLVNLSGALAEWTGGQKSAKEVTNILAKAMLGEREQLKTLGISIKQTDIDARLAAKGLSKLTGEMLQQATAAATLELVTEKSIDAQNAYKENSGSLIRTQAELRAEFVDLKESIAKSLLPVFARLAKAALPLVKQFSALTKRILKAGKGGNEFSRYMRIMITVIKTMLLLKLAKIFLSWNLSLGKLRLSAIRTNKGFAGLGRTFKRVGAKAKAAKGNILLMVAAIATAADKTGKLQGLWDGALAAVGSVFDGIPNNAFSQAINAYNKSVTAASDSKLLQKVLRGDAFALRQLDSEINTLTANLNALPSGRALLGLSDTERAENQELKDIYSDRLNMLKTYIDNAAAEAKLKKDSDTEDDKPDSPKKSSAKALTKKSLELRKALEKDLLILKDSLNQKDLSEADYNQKTIDRKKEYYNAIIAANIEFNKADSATVIAAKIAKFDLDNSRLDLRLKQLKSNHDKELLLLRYSLAQKEITQEEYDQKVLDKTRGFYQSKIDANTAFNQAESTSVIESRLALAELEDTLEKEKQAKKLANLQEGADLEQAELQRLFEDALFSEAEYEQAKADALVATKEAELAIIEEYEGKNTDAYLAAQESLTDAQRKQSKTRTEIVKAEAALKQKIQEAEIQAGKELLSATLGFLSRDKAARKKNAQLIKAFSVGQIFVNTQMEISKIWATQGINPIIAGIRTAAALLRGFTAISKVNSAKFARGGFTGPGILPPDETGHRPTGVVHDDEFVAPKWQVNSPKFRPAINFLNAGLKGYASGGPVGFDIPDTSSSTMQFEELNATVAMLANVVASFPRESKARVVLTDLHEVQGDYDQTIEDASY